VILVYLFNKQNVLLKFKIFVYLRTLRSNPSPAFHSDVIQFLGIGGQTGLRGPYGKEHKIGHIDSG
jgi:hypothetical protein